MEDFLSTAVNVTANRGNSLINRKMILRILGILLFMEAMMFLVCAGVSLCYGEEDYIYFIYTTLINMAVGSGLILLGRGAENRVTRRDGYCIVAFTWLLFTGFGMLPFYISGSIPSVTDAFLKPCRGLPLREPPFWMILKHFRTVCCSGAASRNGLEDWESYSLRLPCYLSSEWAIRCFSRQKLRG